MTGRSGLTNAESVDVARILQSTGEVVIAWRTLSNGESAPASLWFTGIGGAGILIITILKDTHAITLVANIANRARVSIVAARAIDLVGGKKALPSQALYIGAPKIKPNLPCRSLAICCGRTFGLRFRRVITAWGRSRWGWNGRIGASTPKQRDEEEAPDRRAQRAERFRGDVTRYFEHCGLKLGGISTLSIMSVPSRIKTGQKLRSPRLRFCGLLLGISLSLGCSERDEPAPVEGKRLSALELGTATLLPAAGVNLSLRNPKPAAESISSDAEDGSLSIGTASGGRLVAGKTLAEGGRHIKLRPTSKRRRAIYATQRLLDALTQAAESVGSRWPGSVLFVGDLSARHGGDIPHHASHNSGRDADLAFYARDEAGRFADSEVFDRYDASGFCKQSKKTFDTARNWALVESLLRNPDVELQWIFVVDHLEKRMLSHAREIGVDRELLDRARIILKQPGDSSPHADHFHIRIYCGRAERLQGCLNNGRIHQWAEIHEDVVMARMGHVLPFLQSNSRDEILYAITTLVRLRARTAVPHIKQLRSFPDKDVREMATDAVGFLSGRRTPSRWEHLSDVEAGE